MKLTLVPIEGEKVISEEEKERLRKRAEPIPPEKLRAYSPEEQKDIKQFLVSLVSLTEQVHNDMEQDDKLDSFYAKEMEKLQGSRNALFHTPTEAVAGFIKLLDFFPMEPWHEFEMMIAGVRGEDMHHYYETKLKAATDTHHVSIEDDLEKEQEARMLNEQKCRITANEIRDMIYQHPLEDLVKHLVNGRRLISGEFWDAGYYDF
jgi:hypothetical protein